MAAAKNVHAFEFVLIAHGCLRFIEGEQRVAQIMPIDKNQRQWCNPSFNLNNFGEDAKKKSAGNRGGKKQNPFSTSLLKTGCDRCTHGASFSWS
jgi:hypothetical protein